MTYIFLYAHIHIYICMCAYRYICLNFVYFGGVATICSLIGETLNGAASFRLETNGIDCAVAIPFGKSNIWKAANMKCM